MTGDYIPARMPDPTKRPAMQLPATAWAVLEEVIKVVLAEPRRLNMNVWGRDIVGELTAREPDCGTTACIAGWVIHLTGRDLSRWMENCGRVRVTQLNDDIPSIASDLLGFGANVTDELFMYQPDEPNPFDDDYYDDETAYYHVEPGSVEYAERVVRRLRQFMADHRERLRDTIIKPPQEQEEGA